MSRPKNHKEREIVVKAIISLFRTVIDGYSHHTPEPLTPTDLLLVAAVVLGQSQGKNMTAAKVGQYAGIPRTTAARRLAQLASWGCLEVDPESNKVHIPLSILNEDSAIKVHKSLQEIFHHTSQALTKMAT